MKELSLQEFKELIASGKTFVLYVRSDSKKNTIKEVFDTDVVIPELERVYAGSLEFYSINADENMEILKSYRLPSLVLFSEGKEVRVLEGIRAWSEYVEALSCL